MNDSEMTAGASLMGPSEIVVERFYPTVRAMLANRLAERGFTQQAIAAHLGVTQAAVSKYASGEVAVESRFREDRRTVETVERIADGLASGEMDGYDALAELLELVREFVDRGPLCDLHEEAMPQLAGTGCDLCLRGPDAAVKAERDALASVRKAARILATTPNMADVVPNVGTNVGMALRDPTDVTDVAAVPGRIYAVDRRVEVPANPAFGASRHVATTILAANQGDAAVRGAVNLGTHDAILDAAKDREFEIREFDPEYEDRADRLAASFRKAGVPDLLYHRGAFGIEPITYAFGETAVDAAELVTDLVEAGRTLE
ncbi:MAG: thiamine-phosphate synthase family protein [Halanaeroarchaeum sp.]